MSTAEVVTENGHQIVRLPEGCLIEGNEVSVKRVGRSLLLVPKDSDRWRMLIDSLSQFTDDYMQDRVQSEQGDRGPLFE